MKKVISTNHKLNALKTIYKDAKDSGLNAAINKFTHCVDILDDDGLIIEQRYPTKGDKVPGTRNRYQYVGPGNGDYRKTVKVVNEQTYETNEPYIKYIYKTNDLADGRSVESAETLEINEHDLSTPTADDFIQQVVSMTEEKLELIKQHGQILDFDVVKSDNLLVRVTNYDGEKVYYNIPYSDFDICDGVTDAADYITRSIVIDLFYSRFEM